MSSIERGKAGALGLLVFGGVAALAAQERIIFVDPPLRLLSQCELREWNDTDLTCAQAGGKPVKIALAPGAVVSKGRDTSGVSGLRAGDKLDIKLGIDARNRDVATFIWANLVKVEGVLGAVTRTPNQRWFRLRSLNEKEGETFVWIDQRTAFLAGASRDHLREGGVAIVIGERIADRRVVASRILVPRP